MTRKLILILLVLTLTLSMAIPAAAAPAEDIVVLYTNDVHTYIANDLNEEPGLTYSLVAALKQQTDAILVDAGDHVQGTAYGGMDNGATIIELMNAVGYDLATLGNHEFDYGMDGCMKNIAAANFPYISCNFHHETDGIVGGPVLEPYVLFEKSGVTIAFVGITTPETFTSSTPAYFQNADGDYIYGILGGEDGAALYAAVQSAIDAALAAGADYVIGLGHLGVDLSSGPWTSRAVIANTTGFDAFIDGHSHTVMAQEAVADKNGETVLLTQTGSYLGAIGKLSISTDGSIKTELLSAEALSDLTPDAAVRAIESTWVGEIDAMLGTVIGRAEITFDNYDAEGNRLVRRQSTNTGDFSADALYYLFDEMGMDVDVAVMNGGGVRNKALTGDLSYRSCKEIHTFGNVACLLTVTGQQLLDALEWGVAELRADGAVETGGFLHVSGARFGVDLSIPSTVQKDDKGVWTGGPTGAYRIHSVEIYDQDSDSWQPLDLTAKYNLAGYNYTLRDLGGGYAMFDGAVNVLDYVAEDYMVLANYIQSFPVNEATGLPTIGANSGYAEVTGSGRIRFTAAPQQNSYTVQPGDTLWGIAAVHYGDGVQWQRIYEANRGIVSDPALILVGQQLTLPAA